MTQNELKDALDKHVHNNLAFMDYFHGFVLDKPISFNVLFKDMDLNRVSIVLADELIGLDNTKSILAVTCGEFSWKNNQIIPIDIRYIYDANELIYACKIEGDLDKEEMKIVLNATIYVKDEE